MARTYLDTRTPIAALATPRGRGALAVIRVSGEGSIELCAACVSAGRALQSAPGYSMSHGFFVDPRTGEKIDEIVAAVFRNPHSFTGEDSVEISCHGSAAVADRILSALESAGFAPALPGEFSFRAFINGKTDLVRAEAVNELAGARCETARADALERLTGSLSRQYSDIRSALVDILAEVEARLDYPEDEGPEESSLWQSKLRAATDRLEKLSRSYMAGRLRREGALVVIAGRPNAGKSSLFNLMVREERAIVSPEPGTTRDWLETWIEMGGYAIRLIDTAGLRNAEAEVEAEGVRRSRNLADKADILLYLVDASEGLDFEDRSFALEDRRVIRIWNKVDSESAFPAPEGWLGLSARRGDNLESLEVAMREKLVALTESGASGGDSEIIVASERQKGLIDKCVLALGRAVSGLELGGSLDGTALELKEAADYLGEITGEITSEEVFDRIFGSFCLGK